MKHTSQIPIRFRLVTEHAAERMNARMHSIMSISLSIYASSIILAIISYLFYIFYYSIIRSLECILCTAVTHRMQSQTQVRIICIISVDLAIIVTSKVKSIRSQSGKLSRASDLIVSFEEKYLKWTSFASFQF